LIEYKKVIEPVQTLSIDGNKVTIINRYDFMGLDHLRCRWCLVSDGDVVQGDEIQIPKGNLGYFVYLPDESRADWPFEQASNHTARQPLSSTACLQNSPPRPTCV
jgi:hypothetical protein